MKKKLRSNCRHCNQLFIIVESNYRIARFDVLKLNGQRISPHSNKNICDNLTAYTLINGG